MLGHSPLSDAPLSALPLSGGGASYSIAADLGTFALTGVSAGLARGLKAGVTVGTFSVSGINAGLAYGRKMSASVGALSLSGQIANLKHDHKISGGAGSLSFTGNNASLSRGFKLTASLGSFVFTGKTATLLYLPANLGEYIIDDFEATPLVSDLTWEKYEVTSTMTVTRETSNVTEGTYSWRLQGTVDNTHVIGLGSPDVSLATFTIDLSAYTHISMDIHVATMIDDVEYTLTVADSAANSAQATTGGSATGSYTLLVDISSFTSKNECYIFLAGQKATPSAPSGTADVYIDNLLGLSPLVNTLQASKGTFTLSGANANLKSAHTLYNTAGAVVLTGVSAALTKGIRLPASEGSFTLTGVAASFIAPALRIQTDVGSISIAGNNAGLKKGYKTAGAVGSFALSGTAVAFAKTSRTLIAERASFVLTAPVAGIRKGSTMAVSAGSFTLTGVAASFEKVTKITCTVGEIEAFGPPPHLTTTGKFWAARSNRIDRHDIVF